MRIVTVNIEFSAQTAAVRIMSQNNGLPTDEGTPVTPEVEIQDISYWIRTISSKIADIEASVATVKNGLEQIQNINIEAEERLGVQLETESFQEVPSLDFEKLTLTAKELIEDIEPSPLTPEEFKEFLMEKSFGRPKPSILPIVRKYTPDVDGLTLQLRYFKGSLMAAHTDYMNEHKKDENLKRRIERLLKNIEEEQRVEYLQGRHQTSIMQYAKKLRT